MVLLRSLHSRTTVLHAFSARILLFETPGAFQAMASQADRGAVRHEWLTMVIV